MKNKYRIEEKIGEKFFSELKKYRIFLNVFEAMKIEDAVDVAAKIAKEYFKENGYETAGQVLKEFFEYKSDQNF